MTEQLRRIMHHLRVHIVARTNSNAPKLQPHIHLSYNLVIQTKASTHFSYPALLLGRRHMQTRIIKLPQHGRRLIQHAKDPLPPFDQQRPFLLDLGLRNDPSYIPSPLLRIMPAVRWSSVVRGRLQHLSRSREGRRRRRQRNGFFHPIRLFPTILIRHSLDRRQRRQREMIPWLVVSSVLVPALISVPMLAVRAFTVHAPIVGGRRLGACDVTVEVG